MKASVWLLSLLLMIPATRVFAQGSEQIAQLPLYAKRTLDVAHLRVAAKTGRVPVTLPDGKTLRFVPISERERHSVRTVRARSGAARLLLTTDGGNAYGFIEDGARQYRITTIAGQAIIVDAAMLVAPEDLLGTASRNDTFIDEALVERIRERLQAHAGAAANDLVYSVIDIAVFLDPALLTIATPQALRTQAQAYVDFTNEAFITNEIPGELNLVLVEMFPGSFAALDPFPGFVSNAAMQSRADQFGADLRHFLHYQRPGTAYCGQAFLVGRSGVSGAQCGPATFAHEVGHNLGAHHDRANAVGNVNLPISAYNYGYVCGGRGTIMSYVGQPRLSHYSAPDLTNGGEACGVPIGQPNAAHNAAAIDTIRVQIESLAAPQTMYGTVRLATTSLTLDENGDGADVTIVRDGDLTRATSVEVATVDDSAQEGVDYEPVLTRIEFAANESSRTVQITPLDDEEFEPAERFDVDLRFPLGLSVAGPPLAVTVNSDDLDRGLAEIETQSFGIWENAGPARITVRRTGTTTNPLTVSYATVNQTAIAGADYDAVAGQITFAPGETSRSIDVPLINDELYENQPKSFAFTLSGANLGPARTVVVWVWSEDPNRGRAEFAQASMDSAEDAGIAQLNLRRIEGAESTLSLDYATADGTALAGRDYTATSGSLTFAPGEVSKTLQIPLRDNERFDGNRAFSVTLTGAHLASARVATVTVINEDPNRGVAQFGQASYEVDEASGSIAIGVERTGGAEDTLTVGYETQNASAQAGRDYQSTSGQLQFAAGVMTATLSIPVLDDIQYDPQNSDFTVRLTGELLGAPAVAAIRIINDDPNRGRAQWSGASATVNENAGSVTLTLARLEGTESTLEVQFATANGSARAGVDYQAASGVVTFAAGETTKSVQINVTDNAQADGERSFTVNLTGDFLSGAVAATVTIRNDDAAPSADKGGGGALQCEWLFALLLLIRYRALSGVFPQRAMHRMRQSAQILHE